MQLMNEEEIHRKVREGATEAVAIAVAKQREVEREKRVKRKATLPQAEDVTNDANAS